MGKGIRLKDEENEKYYPNPYLPVGSIYLSVTNTKPSEYFGGTKQFIPMPNAFLQINTSNQLVLNASNMISVEYEVTLEYTKL